MIFYAIFGFLYYPRIGYFFRPITKFYKKEYFCDFTMDQGILDLLNVNAN